MLITQPLTAGLGPEGIAAGLAHSSYCWPAVPHFGTTAGLSRGSRL